MPVRAELLERIETLGGRLRGALVRGVEVRRANVRALSARLPRLETILGQAQQRYDRLSERLGFALLANVRAHQAKLDRAAARLRPDALRLDISRRAQRVSEAEKRLRQAMRVSLQRKRDAVVSMSRVLESLSHVSALKRGFALVTRPDGALVRRAGELNAGDAVQIGFADGPAAATIQGGETRKKPRKGGDDQGSLL